MQRRIRQIFRLTVFAVLVASYALTGLAVIAVTRKPWARRRQLALVIHKYSKWTLRLLGAKVVTGADASIQGLPASAGKPSFVVANHISYIDVLVLAAQFKTVFVTSTEIRDTPFLGELSKLGGCLFVERRNRERQQFEVADITQALRENICVGVFPEATSTNGEAVLRFRRPLFLAAVVSGAPVQPVTLNYRRIEGEPVGALNRDEVAWYGSMSFLPHLWNLMGRRNFEIELAIAPALNASSFACLETLASTAREKVAANFTPLSCDSTREPTSRKIGALEELPAH